MSWHAPKTWSVHDVPTDTDMNEISDDLVVLKTVRDDAGRLSALSAATLADLSAANLTGLAVPGAGNAFTAGRTRFLPSATFVFPVGADKWAGTKGVDAGGSVWVEGDYLHHIASDNTTEWRYLGTSCGAASGARVGSGWVEGDDLHYVDESGVDRKCIFSGSTAVHADAAALGGSPWVETYVHWIRESGSLEKPGHADVTHTDHSDHSDHNDHSDTGPHTDHSDHTDATNPHTDYTTGHVDHTDIGHADTPAVHNDHTDHTDHTDHGDTGSHGDSSWHNDSTPHGDVPEDRRPVVV